MSIMSPVRDICKVLKGEPEELHGGIFDVVVCSMVYHHFDPAILLDTTKILASSIRQDRHLAIVDNKPINLPLPTSTTAICPSTPSGNRVASRAPRWRDFSLMLAFHRSPIITSPNLNVVMEYISGSF
ncbi:hexaprenyldihydroxybenzoate methyltransferase [Moniliophthora roreri MCA 2997]|uniref:Hexaprenyldihydroxybenzoate methyltransferase n=1 Tax=Moniliophthora roreri (strain MCA 2997) TaxID=1381753 RepID=V2YH02_MONRO|nr:hexaprenyldihydroxybenzoate methyltransferase [Moniliophthora roreri MCA 2997]